MKATLTTALGPDVTQVARINGAMDPFMGVPLEAGWHYVRVAEHQPGLGLPSNKLKFLRMGYEIAPCDPETRAIMDEGKMWVMRIPQEIYDARVAASREQSKANRSASKRPPSPNMIVTQDESVRKSLDEIMGG